MAIRTILQLGNPLLRDRCESVANPSDPLIARIVQDLADTVRHSFMTTGYGRAIAAPQIGEMLRIIYLDKPQPIALINPEITQRSQGTMVVWDACLSFLCIFMKVRRHCEVTVRYSDLTGAEHILHAAAENDLAELLQHEIDHLDGILALDRLEDPRSICTREEFESRFKHESPYALAYSEETT